MELIHLCKCKVFNNRIAAANDGSLLLSFNGQVYRCGPKSFGYQGINKGSPSLIVGLQNIIQVSANLHNKLALAADGSVYKISFDLRIKRLQLPVNNIIQICAGYDNSLTLSDNGIIYSIINKSINVVPYNGLDTIILLAHQYEHTLALTNTNQIFSMGHNKNGELGLGDTIDRDTLTLIPKFTDNIIIDISAGAVHSLFLDENGQVYTCGYDQLGPHKFPVWIDQLNNIISISCGWLESLLLDKNGQIYSLHTYESYLTKIGIKIFPNYQIYRINTLNNIVQISSGKDHFFALTSDNQVYTYGDNSVGGLCLGHRNVIDEPTIIPNLIL